MHTFKGLIKCIDCGKNYKFKLLRKKPSYICSGFANYSKEFCINMTLEEGWLLFMVKRHMEIIKQKFISISDHVEIIEVSPKENTYWIKYKDGTESMSSPSRLKF